METLGQYFSYNNNPEVIRDSFIELDNQLKLIHERGYSVEISSSSIVYENGLGFSKFNKGLTEEERRANIEDLAKLAVGTYFSTPIGVFSDYTHLPNDYIRENFDAMETCIFKTTPDDSYYREVLVNGKIGYYNDYLKELRNRNPGKATTNNRVLNYSTPEGRAMSNNEESAFLDLAFYPIIGTLFAILSYVIYILVK